MHDQTVWRLAKGTKKGIALLGEAGSIRREPVAALDTALATGAGSDA